MASSPPTPTPPKGSPDHSQILTRAIQGLTLQSKVTNDLLLEIKDLLAGFTSGGAPFRSYQISPLLLVYAAILGPIFGDRLDGGIDKSDTTTPYEETMTRGAAVMAAQLISTLEKYGRERAPLDYLERACGDINIPPEQTP